MLSNSTNYGETYLSSSQKEIKKFLGNSIQKAVFIPYEAVSNSYDAITEKVRNIFENIGYQIDSVHLTQKPQELIQKAEAIVIAGGNTFHLIHWLHKKEIIQSIRERVNNGTPYVGWSAGSNIACPTIKTTNDMPIIEPISFQGLNLVPFQINPHYTNEAIPNHNGETREKRIDEFLVVNPNVYVVGLPEGTILKIENSSVTLIGRKKMVVFKAGQEPKEYDDKANLDFLLN